MSPQRAGWAGAVLVAALVLPSAALHGEGKMAPDRPAPQRAADPPLGWSDGHLDADGIPQDQAAPRDTAVFAGGCFWCMEPPFDKLDGVLSTIAGYAGGHVPNPSYEAVTRGGTGHREVVQVVFDPSRVSYDELLEVFWRNVDPLDGGGQFCDRGHSYTTAIFPRNQDQARRARASKERIQARFRETVVTPVEEGAQFYPAEEYHQDYYLENPIRYRYYRWSCGRDARLKELWGEVVRPGHSWPHRPGLLRPLAPQQPVEEGSSKWDVFPGLVGEALQGRLYQPFELP